MSQGNDVVKVLRVRAPGRRDRLETEEGSGRLFGQAE